MHICIYIYEYMIHQYIYLVSISRNPSTWKSSQTMMSHAEMCNDKKSWSSSVDAILFNNWVYDFMTQKSNFYWIMYLWLPFPNILSHTYEFFPTPMPDNIKNKIKEERSAFINLLSRKRKHK